MSLNLKMYRNKEIKFLSKKLKVRYTGWEEEWKSFFFTYEFEDQTYPIVVYAPDPNDLPLDIIEWQINEEINFYKTNPKGEAATRGNGEVTEGRKIDVLDHGFVRLADYMGGDLSVVRAARVSYDAAWRAGENEGSDAKLIRYLWKNKHSTPFEAVEFQFEIKAPIFVLRQWQRHRTWSYNEVSARYTELPEEFYVPDLDVIGTQSAKNKQGRDPDDIIDYKKQEEIYRYGKHCAQAFFEYRTLLLNGWPRELARCILPLSTYSHMFAKVNLWNLFHFLTLRTDGHAQYEIRQYANAMLALIAPIVPVCVSAWSGANEAKSS